MISAKKTTTVLFATSLLLAPLAFLVLAGPAVVQAAGEPRAPNVIATTLAFIDGNVVTVQYSNIYFCNSAGPPTSSTSSPCAVGADAMKDPVPDVASNTLNVIVPAFLHPLCDILGICGFTVPGFSDGASSVLNPALGDNVFAQCPDNTSILKCPNHPNFLDLLPSLGSLALGVIPLPIHTHVLNTSLGSTHQGGWWKLKVWLVLDPSIWPNASTGACTVGGTSCLTSISALLSAKAAGAAVGPVLTTIYLFFNVVSASAK